MLMSKSRLEKFLYALYSLDSSDLPTPLSRIEELYKCLVTGEEPPTFEPLSRVEKYLMAILGVYDVNSLPNPLSRVEVLLYKLATGDDNLDDVKSFLSEHEELLAEIIRTGGIDIEYILHTLSTEFSTLYNTAERPVKSAILKGNTKYRDIDTGDILDTFDETKNLELVSVKMPVLKTTGKNLFDSNNRVIKESNTYGYIDFTDYDRTLTFSIRDKDTSIDMSGIFFGVTYQGYNYDRTNENGGGWLFYDGGLQCPSLVTSMCKYFSFYPNNQKTLDKIIARYDIQIEESSHSTSYEPYKSNILTANEEVELRGIGDVKDELNLLTGELTQRIGEIVLDGSENWGTLSQGRYVIEYILNNVNRPNNSDINFKCDKLKPISYSEEYRGTLGISLFENTNYDFIIRTDIQTINEFKQWLSNNPTTVHYQLSTESVKTVDLTIADQDGNILNGPKSYKDVTHIEMSAEDILPELTISVATQNEEDISTMSVSMDDIAATQSKLQETSDEQSSDVDSTMLATTEIYEEIL